jgi:glycosyltransferase involved in cell wall biosynthesis
MDKQNIKVSVVIPTFNMSAYVDSAVRSVLRGTFNNFEIIVVDDGSTDSTYSTLSKYTNPNSAEFDSRVNYYYQSNSGKSSAVNKGFEVASGSFVTILDADDKLTKNSLESRYKERFAEKSEKHDIVVGGFEVFDRNKTYGKRYPPNTSDSNRLFDQFYTRLKTPFSLNACLVSRALIDRVGGLDEKMKRCMDGDYALRLLKNADNLNSINKIVYRYRKDRTSALNRMKYRLMTAQYRPQVVWKNYDGLRRWAALPYSVVMDVGKLVYEMFDSYKK